MRYSQASLPWLLFSATTFVTQAFVPARLAATTTARYQTTVPPTTLRSSIAATLEPVESQRSLEDPLQDPEQDHGALSLPNLTEYTDILLDLDNYPVGSLPKHVMRASYDILFHWGQRHTVEAAQKVVQLLKRLEQENQEILNNRHYTIAVDAWAQSGHAKRAEEMLWHMEDLGKKNSAVDPTRSAYGVVANAYAAQGKPKEADSILRRMEKSPYLTPSCYNYDFVLGAYTKKGQARQAEDLLKRMMDLCEQTGSSSHIHLTSYHMVLDALAESKESGSAQRARGILEALITLADKGEIDWQPDQRTYSKVITAFVRNAGADDADQAQSLFDEALSRGVEPDCSLYLALMHAYASLGDVVKTEGILKQMEEENKANSVAYNIVMNAWKSSGSPEAMERAEQIFQRQLALGKANTVAFSTLMAVCASEADAAAAQKAENLLRQMEDLHLQGNEDVKPNVQTYNTVLNSWVQCGDPVRAEMLLEEMEKMCNESRAGICPNVVSYTTLMNGWLKTNQKGGPARAKELFQRLRDMYEAGNKSAEPNVVSYVNLISAIIQSKENDFALKAEETLFEMYKQYKDGKKDLKPAAGLISLVVDGWHKSGARHAGERAEKLLDWNIELYKDTNDKNLQPNEYVFSSAIAAWSKSRTFGKAARAQSILQKMKALYESGVITAAPNTYCYTAVLNSCAYCMNDELEKKEALKIALDAYKELERTPKFGRPNHVTYATMFTVLSNLLPPSEARSAAITSIFKRCCETGQVHRLVTKRLESSLSTIELKQICSETMLAEDGMVKIERLPKQWRRNVRT